MVRGVARLSIAAMATGLTLQFAIGSTISISASAAATANVSARQVQPTGATKPGVAARVAASVSAAGPASNAVATVPSNRSVGSALVNNRDTAPPPSVGSTAPSPVRTDAAPAIVTLPPNFLIGVAPAAQTVTAGNATSYTISIQPIRGFADPVNLSVDLPAGTLGTFNPNPASTSSTLTVTTSGATPGGLNLLAVTGTSGITVHTIYLALTVPDFSLGASPSSQTVPTGSSTTYTVTVQPTYGFSGPVTLSVDGLPSGAAATFNPNPTAGSSVLSVTAACSQCPPGSYVLTITGVGGLLVHRASVTLILGPPPPPPPPAGLCGAPPNPWGYNFCSGFFITSPPTNFCAYFACIPSFWTYTNGYVEECLDGLYSHSGGQSGSCSYHGGNWRALYSP